MLAPVAIGFLERHVRKASHRGSKQQYRSCSQSLLLLLACATHTMVLFFPHIPFVVNHTINATPPERLQQYPLLFATNHTDRTFSVWRLNSARSSHPGHTTILLRSEIPSGMCAKLRTVAASNNRDHARNLSYYCLLALHIWWCYSSSTSRSWWITQSTQHYRRGCNTSFNLHRLKYCWPEFIYCICQPNELKREI